jgi:REP element-mobilizing transposase RayT
LFVCFCSQEPLIRAAPFFLGRASRCDVLARQRSEGGTIDFTARNHLRLRRLTLRLATRTARRALPYLHRASDVAPDFFRAYAFAVDVPRRKTLPHAIPLWIDPQREIYFITINCELRGTNQLAVEKTAAALFETVRHRQDQGLWWPHIFLLMPDHLHALISFPPSGKPIKHVVSKWKEWTAKTLGIRWQRDFFEHRLRQEESRREKADYILENPVRKKLVMRTEDWPFVYFAAGQHPPFR